MALYLCGYDCCYRAIIVSLRTSTIFCITGGYVAYNQYCDVGIILNKIILFYELCPLNDDKVFGRDF